MNPPLISTIFLGLFDMLLLPPVAGTCSICATRHEPDQPHNQQSLYYQYRFYCVRGRWPTWADAIAHCAKKIQTHWRCELKKMSAWSEPADGEPIADPPEESICQPIGDVSSPSFGPDE